MAFRFKATSDGGRQIVGIVMPGDICDVSPVFAQASGHTVECVTDCEVAVARTEDIVDLITSDPRIGRALLAKSMSDAEIAREWILNVGRRSARQRIAHLICEVFACNQRIAFDADDTCTFPLTQEQLADATGLSIVHVNRTLQDMRSAGLITLQQRVLVIHDWERLCAVADFDQSYLRKSSDTFRGRDDL